MRSRNIHGQGRHLPYEISLFSQSGLRARFERPQLSILALGCQSPAKRGLRFEPCRPRGPFWVYPLRGEARSSRRFCVYKVYLCE